ncbi:ABC-2 transporter permease [Methanorbis rubei]|uniref:ABC-2 transporter permease n=1 Tax=Methanorbis rubei TaxID=3028300 RepID=A0AAE4SBU5_9EURY|nr:hypothetical protein [Methanocorpusculaceae archaeon Cs1]
MNGLLYKDLANLNSTLKYLALMILVFSIIFIPMGNELPVFIILAMYGAMLPVTAISYDATARWDKYAITLPLARKEIVRSKYLLMLIATIGAGVVCLAISLIMTILMPGKGIFLSVIDPLPLIALFVVCGLLLGSTALPLVFKLGAEKMQYIILIIVLVPIMLVVGLSAAVYSIGIEINMPPLVVLIAAAAVITAAVVWASYRISTKIYTKKEF